MSLQIRNAIAEHPVAAVVSSAIAMFGVAFGVVAWLHQERIANVTSRYEAEVAVLRARLDRAEGSSKPEPSRATHIDSSTVKTLAPHIASEAASATTSPAAASITQPLTVRLPPLQAVYADIFSANDPYPTEHSRAKSGARLSTLKLIYPDGKVQSWGYDVASREGPFEEITFWMDDEVADPPANRITFTFRNEAARKAVWASAATSFQGVRHTTIRGGAKLVWRFQSHTATLDEHGYHLNRNVP